MNERITKIGLSVATGVALIASVGLAQAVFSGESISVKLDRLELNYADNIQIINRADEVIGKQHDIKMRSERNLHSLVIDIALAKVEVQRTSETPDEVEITRLLKKAADHSSKLGL